MDESDSFGMGNYFQTMLGDLLKMVKTDAPIQWEMAMQFALSIASDGEDDANPNPLERIRLEQLSRIAELHVGDVTGMTVTPNGRSVEVLACGRADWVRRSLDDWRQIITDIAKALQPTSPEATPEELTIAEEQNTGFDALIAKWASAISPMMLSMQIGSVVGHLSKRVLSQYELLLPRHEDSASLLVDANLKQFTDDWSLAPDDLALWLVTRDLTIHSILSRPHVAQRLSELLVRHAAGFRADPDALQDRIGEVSGAGLGDLDELSKLLGDPAALQEVALTPELDAVNRELAALSSTIDGYAEWVTKTVVERVSGSSIRVSEALRRHRVERGEQARTADLLFGLPTDQHSLDRGEAFIRGVIDRAGEAELSRLWIVEKDLPTPAEVEAPGLWLERIKLPS